MDNLDSALNYLIHTGSFGTAVLILRRFRELSGQRETFNNSEIERINASIRKAGSEANTKAVAEVLNSGRDVSAPDFHLYLSQLDKSSIIPLSNLLGEIQDIKFRKALLDALVTLGRDNIDVLAAAIKDKRAHVIRNAVTVLGRIGDKAALEHLKQALAHTDPNVRREVVRALGIIGGPKAGDALLSALEDPDQQIRMSALRYLPGAQSYAVMDSLMEVITRPDFDERAFAEKRAFFEILAEIGQDRVLPFMVKLLHKRSLFGSSKNDEIRATAAYGLGNIHQKEALDALNKEGSRAKKGSVLHEAVSYSIHKLARPSGKSPEE
jgi:HEAT repeat protein